MLRVALEGRSLPVVHGCGWDSGAARERSSALAASVASRYALGADGVGAARPGARGSRVTASRYALGAECISIRHVCISDSEELFFVTED